MDKYSLSYYDYYAPEELIAQSPAAKRDASKLLVVDRKASEIRHTVFSSVIDHLNEGDCLVLNDTKVIPARLRGKKKTTGAAIEILLSVCRNGIWEAMMRNSRRMKKGDIAVFEEGLTAEVTEKHEKTVSIKFNIDGPEFYKRIEKAGEIPLPPYIKEDTKNKEHAGRYQTVYAKNEGASAAPTAGLHFTPELLEKIRAKGVKTAYITLHTGLGTFQPVQSEDIREHKMHTEWFSISREAADLINETRRREKKIIAVGTTSMRTLESASDENSIIAAKSGDTSIFIYPGYEFKAVDGLITNFHLPKTTLLALVYAFGGTDLMKKAYQEAIEKKYRLFSYGDAMIIL